VLVGPLRLPGSDVRRALHVVLCAALVLDDGRAERAAMSKRARRLRRRAKRILERREHARDMNTSRMDAARGSA
jgi:hypothetical protein